MLSPAGSLLAIFWPSCSCFPLFAYFLNRNAINGLGIYFWMFFLDIIEPIPIISSQIYRETKPDKRAAVIFD